MRAYSTFLKSGDAMPGAQVARYFKKSQIASNLNYIIFNLY